MGGMVHGMGAGQRTVIVDANLTKDDNAYRLSKDIARAVERELSYPGQIKVSVVRETRAVRFAV